MSKAPYGFAKKAKPKVSEVFDTYWKFAAERQNTFFARVNGDEAPWTGDPILLQYKFTNAYRASDRVSQYLIKHVIYSKKWSLTDTVFRILLFKVFNKIETWELLEHCFGEISYREFNLKRYERVLDQAMASKASIYSAAYIMPSGPKKKYEGIRKHRFHLELIEHLMKSGFPKKLHQCESMEEAYETFLAVESLGAFLAYQFVTDVNYSEWLGFSEMEFVVPGPGAKDGIKKCFVDPGEYSEQDIIKLMANEQTCHFERLGINFQSLYGRSLQLIDCQNLFCEVDKYSRVAHPDVQGYSGRTRIKQQFKPRQEPIDVWYPPKWGINESILIGKNMAAV
ncbi:MAG: putative DNA base hypermodification protein [Pseudomonadota bacterium]|nr:putative DNA base hypermodification protein [Pseudomonadota bacterium]